MKLLVDSHVVIWWLADDPTLSDDIKAKLDHEPDVFVSAATVWEVAIKQAIGKVREPADLPNGFATAGSAPPECEIRSNSGWCPLPVCPARSRNKCSANDDHQGNVARG